MADFNEAVERSSAGLEKKSRIMQEDEKLRVAFHEAGHSTGHPSRLNRSMGGGFGSPTYAREELVAELTAAFMGQHFGISTELADHNRDYLANWLVALKNDHTLLWDAASDAAKAAATLLKVIPADGDGGE